MRRKPGPGEAQGGGDVDVLGELLDGVAGGAGEQEGPAVGVLLQARRRLAGVERAAPELRGRGVRAAAKLVGRSDAVRSIDVARIVAFGSKVCGAISKPPSNVQNF